MMSINSYYVIQKKNYTFIFVIAHLLCSWFIKKHKNEQQKCSFLQNLGNNN